MGLHVLVVDDSAVMRMMIIKTIRLSELPVLAVHQAANGEEGLRVLDEERVDLALVDINMPVMDGEEMTRRLRERPETAGLPVIVVSTESSEGRLQALLAQGVRFVRKPFTPEALRDAVEALMVGGAAA
jgi:two-component system, chemotaxis family, chemotaxis protein CheY